MSAQPYTQTILLDANRLSSEEFSASNLAQTDTAVFTNKVSGGITLDIGDQVSIQSAHIAQRGAGGEVIEMKGKTLGKKTINYTKFTNSSFVGFDLDENLPPAQYSQTGFAKVDCENIDEEVDMKDNEATIVVEFYKTANGENCMTLPRNFGNVSGRNASVAGYNKATGLPLDTAAEYWETLDGFPLGVNVYEYDLQRRLTVNQVENGDYIFDQIGIPFLGEDDGIELAVKKIVMDNSRFTIFKRASMVYNASAVSPEDLATCLQPRAGVVPDPAVADYVRYKKKVTLRIDEGYNTPSNIASQITDELTEPEVLRKVISQNGTNSTLIQESKLYKSFGCANYLTFNSSGNQDYFGANTSNSMPVSVSSASSVQSHTSLMYLNCYDYIGFKRPDFIEAGRAAFSYHGNKTRADITTAEQTEAVIYTNMTWSDEVLLKIKNFFDSQALYPELLDKALFSSMTNYSTFNTTSASLSASFREVGRFLHIDIGYESQGTAKSDIEPLGDDMYNVSFQLTQNASDKTAAPIYVYFDNNTSHLTANDTVGDTDSNLAYGFARKWGGGFVAFTTKLIGGIGDYYFDKGPTANTILASTKIGYDYHFSGFGNAAIMLHSGYNPLQYYGHQGFKYGDKIRDVYVGADDPLFNFDTTENRFEFSGLHTAERTSNFYNAGDPQTPGDILGPPPSATAQDKVYYINKVMRYDNWSPDMHPYPTINLSGTPANDNVQSFIDPPARFLKKRIFDAHCGVAIADMGIDEKNWTNSIWGLLGFQYGQFNASGSNKKNINTRFNNTTVSNATVMTTNALLSSLHTQQYFQNVFSIPLVKPMVATAVDYYDTAVTHGTVDGTSASHLVSPSIVIQQESTVIKAEDLPRKVLRGYFLINSDILDQANYYQTANPLQTMAVVGKYNSAEDFVNYDGGGAVFTVTRKKTITDIKTQILDPEGELAQVGDNSGVIYRVDKQINTDLKFGENLLAGMYGKPPQ